MPATDRLISLRRKETGRLPPWDIIIRGTLLRYRLTCGKSTCRCHRSKQYRHGPYRYVGVALKGKKRKMVMIPPSQLPLVRRGIAAYNRLWKSLCRISDLNLTLIKAGAWRPDEPKSAGK
ncbi:MAG: hypothetical protein HY796_04120 [Elusimicrobia bacterium]|nr:hypothetical protein [Elusimicrobiota bacterium]